jgi:hypothetical protein
MHRQRATVIATVALWLVTLSIVFAASAFADGPPARDGPTEAQASTVQPNSEVALTDPPNPTANSPRP